MIAYDFFKYAISPWYMISLFYLPLVFNGTWKCCILCILYKKKTLAALIMINFKDTLLILIDTINMRIQKISY